MPICLYHGEPTVLTPCPYAPITGGGAQRDVRQQPGERALRLREQHDHKRHPPRVRRSFC